MGTGLSPLPTRPRPTLAASSALFCPSPSPSDLRHSVPWHTHIATETIIIQARIIFGLSWIKARRSLRIPNTSPCSISVGYCTSSRFMGPIATLVLAIVVQVTSSIDDRCNLAVSFLARCCEIDQVAAGLTSHGAPNDIAAGLPHLSAEIGMAFLLSRDVETAISLVATLFDFSSVFDIHCVGVAIVAVTNGLVVIVASRIIHGLCTR